MKKFTYGILSLLAISAIFLVGCDSPDKVHLGDTVVINYVANFTDGTSFQASGDQGTQTFVVGSGQIIQGLDAGVLGMKVGQTKAITVTPAKGFGNLYKATNIQKVSKFLFDKVKIQVTNGALVDFGGISGIIKGIEKDSDGNEIVLFDINPRETWDTLTYKVTLVSKK